MGRRTRVRGSRPVCRQCPPRPAPSGFSSVACHGKPEVPQLVPHPGAPILDDPGLHLRPVSAAMHIGKGDRDPDCLHSTVRQDDQCRGRQDLFHKTRFSVHKLLRSNQHDMTFQKTARIRLSGHRPVTIVEVSEELHEQNRLWASLPAGAPSEWPALPCTSLCRWLPTCPHMCTPHIPDTSFFWFSVSPVPPCPISCEQRG